MSQTTTLSAPQATGLTRRHLSSAVHHNTALSPQGLLERAFTYWFSGFVYNQIWEDPRVDLAALEVTPDSRILAISSAGCNLLNYLLAGPEKIIAVDLNKNHMSLARLKLAGIKHLPTHDDFFTFFGQGKSPANVERYHTYIAPHLDPVARDFWESGSLARRLLMRPRINYFKTGFFEKSKLGLFMRATHAVSRLTGRDPGKLLSSARTPEEQERIFEEVYGPLFENRVIKYCTQLPIAVYSLGIPPSQHKIMAEESNGQIMALYKERIKRLACGFDLSDNYFAWQAFGRAYDPSRKALPDYLKPENFATLKTNVDKIQTHINTLTGYLKSQPDKSLDRFVFLDSQDWMPTYVIHEMWQQVARVGRPGSRIIFRTSGSQSPIERALPPKLLARFTYHPQRSQELFKQDRSAIYGGFHLYTLNP
jgi:S-adenosylmethionine-diacylglycerol 3-amino-3-carboxypropyl transferase